MNTRMAVAEEKLQQLQTETKSLKEKICEMEDCISGIPRIEEALAEQRVSQKEILTQLKFINECKIAEEAVAKAKTSWLESPMGKLVWDLARASIIGVIAWAALVNQHVVLAGGT